MKRSLIALGSVWFAFSITIATMMFPALVRVSVLCDGINDDDPEWELAIAVRDNDSKKHFADIAVDRSHFILVGQAPNVRTAELKARNSGQPPRSMGVAFSRSYSALQRDGDESLEPH